MVRGSRWSALSGGSTCGTDKGLDPSEAGMVPKTPIPDLEKGCGLGRRLTDLRSVGEFECGRHAAVFDDVTRQEPTASPEPAPPPRPVTRLGGHRDTRAHPICGRRGRHLPVFRWDRAIGYSDHSANAEFTAAMNCRPNRCSVSAQYTRRRHHRTRRPSGGTDAAQAGAVEQGSRVRRLRLGQRACGRGRVSCGGVEVRGSRRACRGRWSSRQV